MRILTRLLAFVLLPAAYLCSASAVHATSCYMAWYLIDVCEAQEDTGASAANSSGEPLFITPDLPEDSLFARRWYGRLADNANVYASPTRAAAPLRNVGDGYLFVTIIRRLQNDSRETWYEINPGEFVHGDDIQPTEASDFQGVEATRQPERPFGWVVEEVTPSSEPDGEPDAAFETLPRYTFVEIYDAVEGQENWIWYDIGDGRWVRQTYFSLVEVSPRPDEVGEDEFWVEVDLYEQTFAAYEGDRLVYATPISSGLNRWPTNEGLFQVWARFREYKMSGAEGKVDYYFLEDVPYIMYFDDQNGIGLHGTYWHDRFGYKHSHGCVNMPIKDAEWTYNWSADAPNDLWVWVHTSDPADHLN
ncbi:MAG: L,D-transpeptidase [Candidatus Promineifilaceae bacterium]